MGDNEIVLVMSVEDSGIENRLCHALHGEEVFVVCGFPDAARISASCHVASDLDAGRDRCCHAWGSRHRLRAMRERGQRQGGACPCIKRH